MSTLPVGIVVPAYRCADFLAATLDGIRAQRFTDWRAVVVDDGSPDDVSGVAADYAQRDERFALLRQENAGVSATRNRGAEELAHASSLLFCDGDDVLLPDALDDLRDGLQRAPGTAAAHGLAELIDGDGVRISDGVLAESQRYHCGIDGRMSLNIEPLGLIQLARHPSIGPPGSVLVDADRFRRSGGFDPHLSYAADWDMWLRLSRLGGIVTVHREVVLYRKHGRNITVVGKQSGYQELRHVRSKTYRSPDNSARERKLLRRVARQHHFAQFKTSRRSERGVVQDVAAQVLHLVVAAYGRPVPYHGRRNRSPER